MFARLTEKLFFIRKSASIHGWLSPLVIMTAVAMDIPPTVMVAVFSPITCSSLSFAVISESVDFPRFYTDCWVLQRSSRTNVRADPLLTNIDVVCP